MKPILSLAFVGALALGCNSNKSDMPAAPAAKPIAVEPAPAPEPVVATIPLPVPVANPSINPNGMPVDLSAGGDAFKGVTIVAPRDAVVEKTDQGVMVRGTDGALPSFQVVLRPGQLDIAARKNTIQADQVTRLEQIAVNEPSALLYQASLGGIEQWHVAVDVSTEGKDFSCEDVHGASYTQENAQAMLDACKSLRLNPTASLGENAGSSAASPHSFSGQAEQMFREAHQNQVDRDLNQPQQ
jgi:hypothetical protein